jgi:putative oligomerization/nucleic acid binding protein
MPGLVRMAARTAVVAGTATAVAGRVSRRQQGRWASQEEQQYYEQQGRQAAQQQASEQQAYQQPPPPAPVATTDVTTQLKQLAELKQQGILTDAEFEAQKQKILAG